jgi:sugar lactone lactonase YvrE
VRSHNVYCARPVQRLITGVVVASLALAAHGCDSNTSSRAGNGPELTAFGRKGHARPDARVMQDAEDSPEQPDDHAEPDAGAAQAHSTRIALENILPGTSAWRLDIPARKHEVEGYASLVSARADDSVQLKVSVSEPQLVHYELYRMGYYQGLGGRFISSGAARQVSPQPACPANKKTGLVECNWETTFEVVVDPSWLTGQYFFKLVGKDGISSYIPLLVRETAPYAPVLVQSSVTTWQAYNVYGGTSLYRNFLPAEVGYKPKRAYAVSFNRPYTCQDLARADCAPGDGDFDLGERWMIQWLEQKGVEVAYVTNLDVDLEGAALLQGHALFMTVGHDEYWPVGERNAVEAARDSGVNLAFVSANTSYWRVRIGAATSGEERRTITCYKDADVDPQRNSVDTTFEYRGDPMPRPEESLIGVMYDDGISRTYFDGFAQIVENPEHWIYEGTGVKTGDVLSYVTGYEWDRAFQGESAPTGREIVAHASLFNVQGRQVPADVSVYYPTVNSVVFGAGAIYWARALSMPGYVDARMQRMFENLLHRAGIPNLQLTEPAARTEPSSPRPISVFAGSGKDGERDGAASEAEFGAPVGLAYGPDRSVYVTDVARDAVRKISPDGQVSTVAGCGHSGNNDGHGTAACFRRPTGIAIAADGTLFVADTGSNLIRRISSEGEVTTVAGGAHSDQVDAADPLQGRLDGPRGLALAPDGTLFIADGGGSNVRKLDGSGLGTMITGSHQPTGIARDSDGSLYIIETRGGLLRKYTQSGWSTLVGVDGEFGDSDGDAQSARIRPADGIAMDGTAVVFTDSANHKLKLYTPETNTVITVAGSNGNASELQMPRGVIVTPKSYLIADTGNHRIVRVPRK